jgi:hypothetical protein
MSEIIHTTFWLRNLKGKEYLVGLRTDGRIILKCILKRNYMKI